MLCKTEPFGTLRCAKVPAFRTSALCVDLSQKTYQLLELLRDEI